MGLKIILKWAKRIGSIIKWLVDFIKSIKFLWLLAFGFGAAIVNNAMTMRHLEEKLAFSPEIIREVVKPVYNSETKIVKQVVEKCQCPDTVSECQNIVTEAIRKNNEKHHPGFK